MENAERELLPCPCGAPAVRNDSGNRSPEGIVQCTECTFAAFISDWQSRDALDAAPADFPLELAKIQARVNAASDLSLLRVVASSEWTTPEMLGEIQPLPIPLTEADANFIRHAKADITRLIAAVRSERGER